MSKTPGLPLPYGIDPVNPVPVDSGYGPYANVAAAKAAVPLALRYDGRTVMITGTGEYWWLEADKSDSGLILKGGGVSPAIVRDIYVYGDASDVTRAGGATNNAYLVGQDALNAAQSIVNANATYFVVIHVGSTTAAIFGDLAITLNANSSRITFCGLNKRASVIGAVTYTAGAGTTTTTINFKNITLGALALPTTVATTINVQMENVICGAVTGGMAAQTINVVDCNKATFGGWTLINSGNTATLSVENSWGVVMGAINTQGNYSLICNSLNLMGPQIKISGVILNQTGTIAGQAVIMTLNNVDQLGNILYYSGAVNLFNKTVTMNNSRLGTIILNTINLGTGTFYANKCTFTGPMGIAFTTTGTTLVVDCTIQNTVNNIGSNAILVGCFFVSAVATGSVINAIAAGCEFYNCSIIGGAVSIAASGGPVSIKFTSGLSTFKAPMGANVTLT